MENQPYRADTAAPNPFQQTTSGKANLAAPPVVIAPTTTPRVDPLETAGIAALAAQPSTPSTSDYFSAAYKNLEELTKGRRDPSVEYESYLRDLTSRHQTGLDEARGMALASLGFGMASGTSGNALTNMGQGFSRAMPSVMAVNQLRRQQTGDILSVGEQKMAARRAFEEGRIKDASTMASLALQRDTSAANLARTREMDVLNKQLLEAKIANALKKDAPAEIEMKDLKSAADAATSLLENAVANPNASPEYIQRLQTTLEALNNAILAKVPRPEINYIGAQEELRRRGK
jgi:hypothetical protein